MKVKHAAMLTTDALVEH